MLQRRGQVHFDGRDVIEDSADLSADKTEENLRQLRASVLRPVEESSGAHRVGGQERPGPVDVPQHGGGPLIAHLIEKRHPPDGAVTAVRRWRRLGELGSRIGASGHNVSHRTRKGADGPQVRGLVGGLLQKTNRTAQDEASSSRLSQTDTSLVEHVERREPSGVVPDLHPQDAALRQVPPQPNCRRVVRGRPHPGCAGPLSPQSGPLPEALGLRPGLGHDEDQRPLAPRPIQVVAEVEPCLIDTDDGDAFARCHISRFSSEEGPGGDGRRTSRFLHCDNIARSRGPAASRPRRDARGVREVVGYS